MNTDARVDAYITKAQPFAQPILNEARKRLRKACPAAVETIKWNVPFYVFDGKLLASMAAFKKHVKVGIWSGMKPEFVDVTAASELPEPKDFERQLQAAVRLITLGAAGAGAKKASAKKVPAKKTSTKQAPAKQVRKAPSKTK